MNHLLSNKTNIFFFIFVFALVCPLLATEQVNYDTAWTFVYDGGKTTAGRVINDDFSDVKTLSDGGYVVVGSTRDSLNFGSILLIRLSQGGEVLWKKLYTKSSGGALYIARNGDFIIGGSKSGGPLILRTDSLGAIKWSSWYYDSLKNKEILLQSAIINSIRETSSGRIICAIGE